MYQYKSLPDAVKQRVLYLLQADNFVGAKSVYDAWVKDNAVCVGKSMPNPQGVLEVNACFESDLNAGWAH